MNLNLPAFTDALTIDDEARKTFTWMGQSYQDEFLNWIQSAITEVEFRQRIQAAIDMLAGRDVVRRH